MVTHPAAAWYIRHMIHDRSGPNVYEMYVANENRAGFFIRRITWGNTIARITTIGGREEGALSGEPPYFGSDAVFAEFYNLDTGERLNESEVSCPGTFTSYYQVGAAELPKWARDLLP